MASYSFEFKAYSRNLRAAVRGKQGKKPVREGLIIRLQDEAGRFGFGEVAPTPSHGSETFAEALAAARQLGLSITEDQIRNLPGHLSCFHFAIDCAITMLADETATRTQATGPQAQTLNGKSCATAALLLPAGDQALAWQKRGVRDGFKTFKWKIGSRMVNYERQIIKALLDALPPGGRLRLDANAQFDTHQTEKWLAFLEGKAIDFLEQPVPTPIVAELLPLMEQYNTPIALDEAISTYSTLEYFSEWPGPLVFKPSIAGAASLYPAWRNNNPRADVVFSSSFETAIGFQDILRLIASDPVSHSRVHGLGVNRFFPQSDRLSLHSQGPEIPLGSMGKAPMLNLWQQLEKPS